MTVDPAVPTEKHVHEWMPNGLTEIQKVQPSPVSTWDDLLYTAVYSITVCKCGETRTTHVSNKNKRRRQS